MRVSAPEVVSGMSGESEAKIRQLFREARKNAMQTNNEEYYDEEE